jgi:hypothetical protein
MNLAQARSIFDQRHLNFSCLPMEITLIAINNRKCSDILTLKRQPSARAMGEATLKCQSDIRFITTDIAGKYSKPAGQNGSYTAKTSLLH